MRQPIVMTAPDHAQLEEVLDSAFVQALSPQAHLLDLQTELRRATIVDSSKVPPDVVTMNSTVELRDLEDNSCDVYTLVFPREADIAQGFLSVFTPIGTAILGYRVGDVISWNVPAGIRVFRIEQLLFQPERESRLPSQADTLGGTS